LKADGVKVLDYRQAETAARNWIARHNRIAAGLEPEPDLEPATPYTIANAMADYMADYIGRGGKGVSQTRAAVDAHILPNLGARVAVRLTRQQIRTWHRDLADSAPRVRVKAGCTPKARKSMPDDPEGLRKRRSTANRILTILKAALNHARQEGRISGSNDAWSSVKPFREADKPRIRYLTDEESIRLTNACSGDFRNLVTAALFTGCRYGELSALRVSDFDVQAATLQILRSKSGKPRHVYLAVGGRAFFERITIGRPGEALIFERDAVVEQATRTKASKKARVAWGKSDQFRQIREACEVAQIVPPISFHELRHTYASRLAAGGASMGVIAVQLGHSGTRMTETHYAHLAPSYVADTVRKAFGDLGIVQPTTLVPLRHRPAL
jgi:integrase